MSNVQLLFAQQRMNLLPFNLFGLGIVIGIETLGSSLCHNDRACGETAQSLNVNEWVHTNDRSDDGLRVVTNVPALGWG